MPMTAAEHFDWAIGRALEHVDQGDGANALASLVSDLGKHEGTAGILTPVLTTLFGYEVMVDGAQGARRFIEGLPRPACGRVGMHNCGGKWRNHDRANDLPAPS